MKGKIIWILKRYFCDGETLPIGEHYWEVSMTSPEDWEKDLFDKVVVFPLED